MSNEISFGISLGAKAEYTYSELNNFIECAEGIEPKSLEKDYVSFLEDVLAGKIKRSTLVDVEVLKVFQSDLDNRADIDYREGHWDDEPDIVAGGKYFAKVAGKLKAHIAKSA